MIQNKNIGLASDHAGFETKELVKIYLTSKGYAITDYGCHSNASCDYADYAHPLAFSVENHTHEFAFSLCGSGNGINMTVNKHQGIRSALCWNQEISRLARLHNNANICAIPARFVSVDEVIAIVEAFVQTEFEGGRHQTRIEKIPV